MVARMLALVIGMSCAGSFLVVKSDSTQPQDAEKLIKDLASETVEVRESAYRKLMSMGRPVLSALKKALQTDDVEVKSRLTGIIKELEDQPVKELESYVKENFGGQPVKIVEKTTKITQRLFPGVRFFTVSIHNVGNFGYALREKDEFPVLLGSGNLRAGNLHSMRIIKMLQDSGPVLSSEDSIYDLLAIVSDLFFCTHEMAHFRHDSAVVRKTDAGYLVSDQDNLQMYGFIRSFLIKVDDKGNFVDVVEGDKGMDRNILRQLREDVSKLKTEVENLKKQIK
jgi:hypothetical protein